MPFRHIKTSLHPVSIPAATIITAIRVQLECKTTNQSDKLFLSMSCSSTKNKSKSKTNASPHTPIVTNCYSFLAALTELVRSFSFILLIRRYLTVTFLRRRRHLLDPLRLISFPVFLATDTEFVLYWFCFSFCFYYYCMNARTTTTATTYAVCCLMFYFRVLFCVPFLSLEVHGDSVSILSNFVTFSFITITPMSNTYTARVQWVVRRETLTN